MANTVFVGCAGLPRGTSWPSYFQRLSFLELAALHTGPVRPALLTKWRAAAPHQQAFGIVAPATITHAPGPRGYGEQGWKIPRERLHEAGNFRATPLIQEAVTQLAAASSALSAGAVIFRSPPDFSPSQSNRDAMRRFFSEIAPAEHFGGAVRVWHPSGLWDPPMAHACARDLGVLCALDPLGADPEGAFAPFWAHYDDADAYFVISGIGRARRRTSNELLETLGEQVALHRRAWVVFATVEPLPDAIRFTQLTAGGVALSDEDGEFNNQSAADGDEDPDDESD